MIRNSSFLAALVILVARSLDAVTLSPGDIIVTEFFDGWHKIDPVTHQVTELPFVHSDSSYLAVDPAGSIYFVSDSTPSGDQVSRLDWNSNATALVPVSGVQFVDGLAVDDDGTLLISEDDSIDRFNPATGGTDELTAGTFFGPAGIARGQDGRVFFTEFFGDLWELSASFSGRRSVPTPDINLPDLITVQPSGDLIVLNHDNELLRVDPDSGATGLFSSDLPDFPVALAVEANGDVLMTSTDGVFRFDGATGARSPVAGGAFFSPKGIVVIPEPPVAPQPGDLNGDGAIDASDYTVWRSQYGGSGPNTADANGDGYVNAADYTVWRDATVPAGAQAVAAIPEPTACTLASLGLVTAGWRRRRTTEA